MKNSEENDWYHGVLNGAMKYIDDEQEKNTVDVAGYSIARETFEPREIKDQFSHLVHTIPGGTLRKAFLKKGFSEGMKGWFDIEMNTTKEGHIFTSIQEHIVPINISISDEEIDDKIANQLTSVLEESVVEFRDLRSDFVSSVEQQHQEFQRRILELSQNRSGGAQ